MGIWAPIAQGNMTAKAQAGIELRGQEEDLVALPLQIMTELDLQAGDDIARQE